MRFLVVIFCLLTLNVKAATQWTNAAFYYMGDSFSVAENWQAFVTNVPNCRPMYQANFAANGNWLGNVVSNQWLAVKEQWRTNGQVGPKVLFSMVGVNPNPTASYVDPIAWDAGQFTGAYSNLLVEAVSSNALTFIFTVTGCNNRYEYSNPMRDWETYFSDVNTWILTNNLATWKQDNENLWPWIGFETEHYPDTLHPNTEGYQMFATNVVIALSGYSPSTPSMQVSGNVSLSGRITIQ